MAVAAATIWTAETKTSCPMPIVGLERSDQVSGDRSRPGVSLGTTRPVREPKPKPRSLS